MIRAVLVTVLAVALVGVPAAAGADGGASPADVIRLEDSFTRTGKFAQLYRLFTPRFRATCPYATFAEPAKNHRFTLQGVRYRIVGQRVTGTKAYVHWQYLRRDLVVADIVGDLYVKIGGRWFDEVDKVTQC